MAKKIEMVLIEKALIDSLLKTILSLRLQLIQFESKIKEARK